MNCPICQKVVSENQKFCPDCGAALNGTESSENVSSVSSATSTAAQATAVPWNKLCIIGPSISAGSLLINFLGLVGLAGLIVSILGLVQVRKTSERGKGLAITGIVVGAASVLFGLIWGSLLASTLSLF